MTILESITALRGQLESGHGSEFNTLAESLILYITSHQSEMTSDMLKQSIPTF